LGVVRSRTGWGFGGTRSEGFGVTLSGASEVEAPPGSRFTGPSNTAPKNECMKNRKQFIVTVAATGAALSVARTESPAQTAPARVDASPAGAGAPSAKPSEKPPSAAALAIAVAMRRFDPKLSDAEVASIAKQLDDNARAGAALNPKKKRLKNSDQPVTIFTVPLR